MGRIWLCLSHGWCWEKPRKFRKGSGPPCALRSFCFSPGLSASLPSAHRYNDFLHDPLSLCEACTPKPNAENAISARSDLNPANGSYPFQALRQRAHGGIDVKVRHPSQLPHGLGKGGWDRCRIGSDGSRLRDTCFGVSLRMVL